MSLPDAHGLTRDEWRAALTAWGEPAYRLDQLLEWLYARRAPAWDAMSNLPRALRQRLSATWSLRSLELVTRQASGDATQKFLWRLTDGALIESVLIPASPALYGEASDRHTLCVSTQVGCAYGCRFCASGLEGWRRNLRPEEIVQQVLAVEQWHAARERHEPALATTDPRSRVVSNLVIMGMGEPLANYDHLLKALRILNAPWGGNIGARKITISTSGLVPQIRRLAGEPEQFRLAISLHGATDAVRDRLMPVNRKYPLRELVAACEHYLEHKGRVITLEYLLLEGVNDAPDHARALVQVAARLRAKVNLIPYNRVEGLPWQQPATSVQEAFYKLLVSGGIQATLRREKGADIDAACGQLRLRSERSETRS
ncbi:MAG: 23S rRNA (adenine(2503)-C(2))-methyltransferase RlmN [Verrucomicrobiales bacterium]|nr:23S rRNA (adenine(2503)-C(2))-methyltransferase RlmN [Verrucomicrobiales bacterium]